MMILLRNIQTLALVALMLLFMSGCGGGGGGGNSGNPGNVSLDLSPRNIDSGDRTKITVRVSSLDFFDNELVVVKVRCPSGLAYVQDSTVVKTNNASENFTSQWSSLERNSDESVYVVTTLSEGNLKGATNLEVSFFMVGEFAVESGVCAIDIDHSNPDEPRFDADDPRFTSLTELSIRVVD